VENILKAKEQSLKNEIINMRKGSISNLKITQDAMDGVEQSLLSSGEALKLG